MRTVFLGAYGYGNLGDELCLIEALQAFPTSDAHAFSVNPSWTMRCVPDLAGCFPGGEEMLALNPARIVFGGGMFGVVDAFRYWMPYLARAMAAGAEIHLHNLGVARLASDQCWPDATARHVFANLASLSVRDPLSIQFLAEVGIAQLPRITFFPEAKIAADPALAESLVGPPREGGPKLLGISIIPSAKMRDCLRHDAHRVVAALAEFVSYTIVPIVSTIHVTSTEEDDMTGVIDFLQTFIPNAPIVAPLLLDRAFWLTNMTPRRLKGLIARCDVMVTQRKHNAIHAIGAGVRVIGLHPLTDDSLRRTFTTLTNDLPPGSLCIGLDRETTSDRPAAT
ncbi:polysaccharide pyruvyl transferase family protein [Roseomonas stagni]|uniref:Polysaccharide pyruvyl transferase family protein n=1 Tax=Falsiroseomonas algicola TaxID=2716930 RepID=A0A6M1LVB8_9PROT|nr:polysaccharide pyruvyl transferase family protein [Falsiroseomonas algicola]NGM24411.1 polysaccharide pyruvyl transferase family protein [Falsiroseomonas algicola]